MSTKTVKFTDNSGMMSVEVDYDGGVEITYEGNHLLTLDNGNMEPSLGALFDIKEVIENAIAELESR